VVSIAGGWYYSLAIKSDGTLWGWGDNQYGQLGDGTVTAYDDVYNKIDNNDKSTPVKIMDSVSYVAAGVNSSFAVKTDGSLWAWGDNECGQLGDGKATTYDYEGNKIENNDKSAPIKIMENVICIASGNHSCAVKSDGSLWAWGANTYGQLGDGTRTDRYEPVKIMDGVTSVAAAEAHSLARKADGSLWAWGYNYDGRIGDGTATTYYDGINGLANNDRLLPVKIMDGVKLSNGISVLESISVSTSITVLLDGQPLTFDQPPVIENGRTLVPLRIIFEELGAAVDWNQKAQTATATMDETNVVVQIGNNVMTKDGTKIILDMPPKILNGRTLVPVRAVAEAFDADVDWDNKNRTVIIETK